MAIRPLKPSSPPPVSTTPTTRGPYSAAAERNNGSTAGRVKCSLAPRISRMRWFWMIMCTSRGARYTAPGVTGSSSSGSRTARDDREPSTRAQCPPKLGLRCSTIRMDPLIAGGRRESRNRSASTPPADAPTTMMSRATPPTARRRSLRSTIRATSGRHFGAMQRRNELAQHLLLCGRLLGPFRARAVTPALPG